MIKQKLEILNIGDSSLSALAKKGNISYVEVLYNPLDFYDCVHHITFNKNDKQIELKNPRIRVHILKRIPKLFNHPLYFLQILWIAKKNRVCLIRGRSVGYGSFHGLLVSKIMNIPFIVSIGGNHRLSNDLNKRYPILHSKYLSNKIEEIIYRNAQMVFCPNQYSVDYVLGLGIPRENTTIIPLRLKDESYDFRYHDSQILKERGVDLNVPFILFIGRFAKDKQVDVLIDTIPLILNEFPDMQFVFIGDGPIRKQLEARSSALGISENVYFLGFQPSNIINYCLAKSAIVWIPMSGFVIYEAASAGKPIIAFDVEWHSEVVINGVTGLLVENRNKEALATAVKNLINNPDLANTLAKNARALIEEKYNPKHIAQLEIDNIMQILKI